MKKKRNVIKHGKRITFSILLERFEIVVHQLSMSTSSIWINLPKNWSKNLGLMQRFRKRLYYRLVTWRFSEGGWIKCNTDGVSKGNPGNNSYVFCVRDMKEM